RHVWVADDAPRLEPRCVVRQAVSLQRDLEGAHVVLLALVRSAHVEGMAVESRWVRACVDEEELRLWIDEFSDQPRARGAIDVNVPPRDPPHEAPCSCAAAASRNALSARSQRLSAATRPVGGPSA